MREMFSSLMARVLLLIAIPFAVVLGFAVYAINRTTGRPGIGFAYPGLDDAGVPRIVVATALSLGLSRSA